MKSKGKYIILIVLLMAISIIAACTIQGLAMEVVPDTEVVAEKLDVEEGQVQEDIIEKPTNEPEKDGPKEVETEDIELEKEEVEDKKEDKKTETKKKSKQEGTSKPTSSEQPKQVEKVVQEVKQEEKKVEKPKEEAKKEDNPKEDPAPEPASPKYAANTIYFNGKAVKYKNGGMSQAQNIIDTSGYASTWGGVAVFSGTDNLHTNFIQHNPGPFAGIWNAGEFIVTDGNGTPFTYKRTAVYEVDDDGKTKDGTDKYYRINSQGQSGHKEERITFFTCVTGNNSRRVVVEASIIR